MATRKPVRVLPVPVGAATRTSAPDRICGQASCWGSVGPSWNREANQRATAGWKSSRTVPVIVLAHLRRDCWTSAIGRVQHQGVSSGSRLAVRLAAGGLLSPPLAPPGGVPTDRPDSHEDRQAHERDHEDPEHDVEGDVRGSRERGEHLVESRPSGSSRSRRAPHPCEAEPRRGDRNRGDGLEAHPLIASHVRLIAGL